MSLKAQLLLLIAVPLLCLFGAGWDAVHTHQTTSLASNGATRSGITQKALNDFILFLQAPPPAPGNEAQLYLQAIRNRIDDLPRPWAPFFHQTEEERLLAALAQGPATLGKLFDQARRTDGAILSSRHLTQLTRELTVLLQTNEGLSAFYGRTRQVAEHQNNRLNLILLFVALAWPVGFSLLLYRTLARPVSQLREALTSLGKGTLSHRLEGSAPGEIGQLFSAVNKAADAQHKAEEAASEAGYRLANLYDNLQMPVVRLDCNGAVTSCNDCLLQLTGRKRHEVVGKNWFELFVPDPAPARERFSQMLNSGERADDLEQEIITQGAEHRLITWHTVLERDSSGLISGTCSIGSDITEQRAAKNRCDRDLATLDAARNELQEANEALQRSREELNNRLLAQDRELSDLRSELDAINAQKKAADQDKRAFLNTLRSELNAPLGAILGLAQLTLQTGLTGKQHDHLQTIGRSAQRLLDMVNSFIDLSLLEAGLLHLAQMPFRLGEVIDRVMGRAALSVGNKPLTLTPVIATGVPDWLLGDPLRLEQVLGNLLSNAVTCTEQGQISLRVSCEATEAATNQQIVRFSVEDSGIGMDEQTIAGLYRPFGLSEGLTARSGDGSGLGLSICRHLVEMMGGSIDVASSPGKGSTFSFSTTFGPADGNRRTVLRAPAPVSEQRSHNLRGYRLLVAEGSQTYLPVIRELFETCGMLVETAQDGAEAVRIVQEHGADLHAIVMDLRMPVMDGDEATRLIRKQFPATRLPIIALTASPFDEQRERWLSAGMNDALPKPIDLNAACNLLCWYISASGQPWAGQQNSRWVDEEPPALPDSLPGIDMQGLLERLNNDRLLLIRLVRLFAAEHRGAIQEIDQRIAESDLPAAARLAHGLAGVAGNLCAHDLQRAAALLEDALKKGDAPGATQQLASLGQELATVLGSAGLLGSVAPLQMAAEQVQPPDELTNQLRLLYRQLRSHNPQAARSIEQLQKGLTLPDDLDIAARLAEAIDHLDFPGAEELLERLATQRSVALVDDFLLGGG